jgi:hypothetical protein
MKNKLQKQIVYPILLLLAINLASAITLEELISSYNFDFDDEYVNVTGITHYGIDTNSNSLYQFQLLDSHTENYC